MSIASAGSDVHGLASPVNERSRFAAGMALAMLIVNFVGFAPTLYLRPLFNVAPIPAYLYAHGVLGTAWFVLVVVQTMLIAKHRVTVHRKLGWAAAALVFFLLISAVYTSTNFVPRNVALGATSEGDIALFSAVTAGDNASFIVFPTLVVLGLCFRRQPEAHKRLMLLASLSILGPAVARISSWYGPIPNPVGRILVVGFLGSLFVYDLLTRRRPHPATALGVLFLIAVNAYMQLSGVGIALVEHRMRQ